MPTKQPDNRSPVGLKFKKIRNTFSRGDDTIRAFTKLKSKIFANARKIRVEPIGNSLPQGINQAIVVIARRTLHCEIKRQRIATHHFARCNPNHPVPLEITPEKRHITLFEMLLW